MTLIEKLGGERNEWSLNPDYWMDSNLIDDVFNRVIEIVKQHSDWVSFNNKPPKNLQRILVCFKEKGIISGTWFADSKNPNDGFFSSDNGLSDFYRLSDNTMDLWQPIQPPSEVQE